MSFVVNIGKERHKFSCSHFTIFGPEVAERLHGHNYYVRLSMTVSNLDPNLGMAFDFNDLKPIIHRVCDELDERVLIPEKSKYLKISRLKEQVEVRFQKKLYSLPAEDVVLLPFVNVTAEELARYIADRIVSFMPQHIQHTKISVNIQETRGQSVTYTRNGR